VDGHGRSLLFMRICAGKPTLFLFFL